MENNNVNVLLNTVDWKRIPQSEINQISYEAICWAKDYKDLQNAQKLLQQPIGRTFKEKLEEWISKRIKMTIDRKQTKP